MDIAEIYDKRLQSEKDVTVYFGYPGSDSTKTLVRGALSNRINSFLPSGFYELKANPGGKNQYVEDVRAVTVVDDDVEDESSVINSIMTAFSDYFDNTGKRISKTGGYLKTGIDETFTDITAGTLDFKDDLIKIALATAVAIALIITYKIWKL